MATISATLHRAKTHRIWLMSKFEPEPFKPFIKDQDECEMWRLRNTKAVIPRPIRERVELSGVEDPGEVPITVPLVNWALPMLPPTISDIPLAVRPGIRQSSGAIDQHTPLSLPLTSEISDTKTRKLSAGPSKLNDN